MDGVGRLFVAVALTDGARRELAVRVAEAVPRGLPGRPVPADNWHITLRFLGSTDQVRYDRLLGALDEADLGEPFRLRFGSLGCFPRPARAAVLWLGVTEGEAELARLAAAAEEASRASGFPDEERPFHAHLTLARIRPHQDLRPLVIDGPSLPVKTDVREVTVYRSHPGRGGVRYEVLETIPLD